MNTSRELLISFRCRYPELPTLEMQNGSYLPMELVDVEPVRIKKITDEQRALLCRLSSLRPVEYQNIVTDIRQNSTRTSFDDPFVAAWKLKVDVEMIVTPARVLPAPEIIYSDGYRVTSQAIRNPGVWETPQTQFYQPATFPDVWAMINLSPVAESDCEAFYNELNRVALTRGIRCPTPKIYEEYDTRRYSIESVVSLLKQVISGEPTCGFFLVILPTDTFTRKYAYMQLKKLVSERRRKRWRQNTLAPLASASWNSVLE